MYLANFSCITGMVSNAWAAAGGQSQTQGSEPLASVEMDESESSTTSCKRCADDAVKMAMKICAELKHIDATTLLLYKHAILAIEMRYRHWDDTHLDNAVRDCKDIVIFQLLQQHLRVTDRSRQDSYLQERAELGLHVRDLGQLVGSHGPQAGLQALHHHHCGLVDGVIAVLAEVSDKCM